LLERFQRWGTCSLCKQKYHGVVACALGWACWKTYVGRPETDDARRNANTLLGNGLHDAGHYEEALSVKEAYLSTVQRLGASESHILDTLTNLAGTYQVFGRVEEANRMLRDVYSGRLKLHGKEDSDTLIAANNYATTLGHLKRYDEVKSLLRKPMRVARRVLGEGCSTTLTMKAIYAYALYTDPSATLDDLRESVTTLEDVERTARRVLGSAHPLTTGIEDGLRNARAALAARETSSAYFVSRVYSYPTSTPSTRRVSGGT
jgi:hypothetical protein